MKETKEKSHSEQQAEAQLASIREMVKRLDSRRESVREDAITSIQEDPLSVEVRTGWYNPGSQDAQPEEYQILLCTGGPACRIIGELENGQPCSAKIEHQDWGTPWTEYRMDSEEEADAVKYAQQFYWE